MREGRPFRAPRGSASRVSDRGRPGPRRPRLARRPGAPGLSPHAVVRDEPGGRAALPGRQGTARRTQLRNRDRLAHPGRTPCHSAARLEEGKSLGRCLAVAGAAATARLPAREGAQRPRHGRRPWPWRGRTRTRPPTGPPPCHHPSAVRPGAKQPIGQVKNPCRPVIFIGKPDQCGYRGVDGRASSPLARPRARSPRRGPVPHLTRFRWGAESCRARGQRGSTARGPSCATRHSTRPLPGADHLRRARPINSPRRDGARPTPEAVVPPGEAATHHPVGTSGVAVEHSNDWTYGRATTGSRPPRPSYLRCRRALGERFTRLGRRRGTACCCSCRSGAHR
jgi:hypothetical protein